MMGMEKNSDVVIMSSYAPLLVNVNDRTWNPDMINFNTSESYGTPSYWLQNAFSNNLGEVNIPVTESGNTLPGEIQGNIGVGTWVTQAEFADVQVRDSKNEVLFEDNFSNASNWSTFRGSWSCSSNSLKQSGNQTDCRAIAENIKVENFTFTLKARKKGGNEGFLIIFGYKDDQNFYWWNIGGWNNITHAIEQAINGTKSIIASRPGSIITNKWYDIKLEINNGQVSCFLDNQLIHKFYIGSHQLYCSSSYIKDPKELIVKVVNPTSKEISGTFDINGLEGNAVEGSAIIISSENSTDENSFVNPLNVSPSTSNIEARLKKSDFSFHRYSINILRLKGVQSDKVSSEKIKSSNQQIKVYPNPATGLLHVMNAADGSVFKMFSIDGRLYKQGTVESEKINVENVKRGIYFLTIESKNLSHFTEKLVIN
jgi:alpha-L-arabinofuranosidase